MNTKYRVMEVSNQVQSFNHKAWAVTISEHDTKEAAEQAANDYYFERCLRAEEHGSSTVPVTVYVDYGDDDTE